MDCQVKLMSIQAVRNVQLTYDLENEHIQHTYVLVAATFVLVNEHQTAIYALVNEHHHIYGLANELVIKLSFAFLIEISYSYIHGTKTFNKCNLKQISIFLLLLLR